MSQTSRTSIQYIQQFFCHTQAAYPIEPLVTFRILFGLVLFLSTLRTLIYGWVDKFYVQPSFFFKFYGFHWVTPVHELGMYCIYTTLLLASLCVILGLFYRIAIFSFFLLFLYTELIDLTHYLNHYYLVSLLCFLMLFVPAHRSFSLDVYRAPHIRLTTVPRWMILIFQLQISIVYIYAGLAKLQADWLLDAQPMKIWLARQADLPLVGQLIVQNWIAYLFSWIGALYDLSIPFFLLWKKTRRFAYATVILFHLLTWSLFFIGLFPLLMIFTTLIFFPPLAHKKIITTFVTIFILTKSKLKEADKSHYLSTWKTKGIAFILGIYFIIQLLFPFRHHLYKDNVLWTEEGFRFSWKVMVIEKNGSAVFTIKDTQSQKESIVNNLEYLTAKQEYMMVSQPDLILQFAHFLAQEYKEKHQYLDPKVTVDCFVSLNGRISQRLIDPTVDLSKEKNSFLHNTWILPFDEDN